jgi:type IV secretion system protein VirB9
VNTGAFCVALLSVGLAVSLMAGRALRAETLPPRGPIDSRVRVVGYNPAEVYRLTGYVGYDIHVELEAGEEYVGLAAGDARALTVDARGSDLFLKPRAVSVNTNITVITTRRRYQFDYVASAKTPDPTVDEVIYSLRFTYPPPPPVVNTEARVEHDLSTADATALRNTDYWYCGSDALRPVAASDDGVHTRIRFSTTGEIPALFVRNEDGSESLLNFSMDLGDVVIHRLAPRFILRRGKLTGCVVNLAYHGAGERLESGTVSPDVVRTSRGARP